MSENRSTTQEAPGVLAQAAALAGGAVAIARHSGRHGTHMEFAAIAAGLEAATAQYPANRLVRALLTPESRRQISDMAHQFEVAPKQSVAQDFKMAALNRCAQAADWLDANASPQEAAEVKDSILAMCRQVAEESKEGDWLGFGGTRVDVHETGVIQEIARALRVVA
jgi:hypothetical protein